MSIFRRPDYQSDATQFINQLKATKTVAICGHGLGE
eukprot:gene41067-50816_t